MIKEKLVILLFSALVLAGCGVNDPSEKAVLNSDTAHQILEDTDNVSASADNSSQPTAAPSKSDTAVIRESDGSLQFNLSDTASILIRSASVSKGVTISDQSTISELVEKIQDFKPYDTGNDFKKHDYSLTFYDDFGKELATIQAWGDYIISYEGKTYYDETEQVMVWPIRKLYIERIKDTFACDKTSFQINGETYNFQDIDISINAITEYSWIGFEDAPDPFVVLVCHINPNVGYCAVFDVETMDYSFGAYGTGFTWQQYSAKTLVYAFENKVYNYWGDILYRNDNSDYYIYDLQINDGANVISIALTNPQTEDRIELTRINYHKDKDEDLRNDLETYGDSILLAQFEADLMHDGSKEKLTISEVDAAGELATLEITASDGELLWLEQAHASHVGWNSVFLCSLNGKDYLLVFNPYQCTGLAEFTYELFYCTGPGTIEIIDSGCFSFNYEINRDSENAFNEAKFRPFADQVYTYLQNSYLLMSTENGELEYSTAEHLINLSEEYEPEKWIKQIVSELY